MIHSPKQAAIVLAHAQKILEEPRPDDFKLQYLWSSLAYIRASTLAKELAASFGTRVQAGPFKDMKLTQAAMVGAFAPYLLGIYEHELHPFIADAIAADYSQILNIGCAFGYYSVGLALRLPNARVYAFDIDETCRKNCRDMATLNDVADRVTVAGEFKGKDFSAYAAQKTFAIVDIEGAELDLLDPSRYPALAKMDFIVELHDIVNPAISRTIAARFAPTHNIKIVPNRAQLFSLVPLGGEDAYVDPFDSLLVGWEHRDGPTPWAVMKSSVRN